MTSRRGRVGATPVVVLLAGEHHAKVMFPDNSVEVLARADVWVEGVDAWPLPGGVQT